MAHKKGTHGGCAMLFSRVQKMDKLFVPDEYGSIKGFSCNPALCFMFGVKLQPCGAFSFTVPGFELILRMMEQRFGPGDKKDVQDFE